MAAAVREVAGRSPRPVPVPVLTVLMSEADRRRARAAPGAGAPPVYEYPEEAALALGRVARYAEWRRLPAGRVPDLPGVRPERAATLLSATAMAGPGWLEPTRVEELFACYGLPLVETLAAADPRAAGEAARRIGGPVALKAVAPGLVHKTDAGAVRLGLAGAETVALAADQMRERLAALGHRVDGFLVQPETRGEVEMLVGVSADPHFGPVVACGLGGTAAEVHRDVAVRLTPLTDLDARRMIRELRTFPLLLGHRGAPPCDVGALEQVVLRVAAMAQAHPQIAELDCNPVAVSPDGAVILDARVRVAPPAEPRPWPSLGAPPPPVPAAE